MGTPYKCKLLLICKPTQRKTKGNHRHRNKDASGIWQSRATRSLEFNPFSSGISSLRNSDSFRQEAYYRFRVQQNYHCLPGVDRVVFGLISYTIKYLSYEFYPPQGDDISPQILMNICIYMDELCLNLGGILFES